MLKVTVIGGGSTYTPEIINGFIERHDSFPVDELWLMDIDQTRLEVVGKFAQRMVAAKGSPFKVVLSTHQRDSIRNASYVVTQLRVGQMPARREDEYLGKRYGLIGQETTGVGGMAKALRTIPVLLDIAKDMQEVAPNALLVNFTNPSGLVTEALFSYAPEITSVGVCNAAIHFKMDVLNEYNALTGQSFQLEQVFLDTLGLNHLTWHRGYQLDGKDIWSQITEMYIEKVKSEPDNNDFIWAPEMIMSLNMIPNYYLGYFYHTDKKLALQNQWPPSRAEEVIEIEKRLLADYADLNLTTMPKGLMERGGAYYSTLATKVLNSHYNDLGEIHEVNVRHNGAVDGWPIDWVLEMPCKISHKGIIPLKVAPLPDTCFGIIAAVKSYEKLTVEAAVHGDYDAAYQALLVHPLGPSADKVKTLLDDMLEINKAYLPAFVK
jgi:6-phospho-beta-glucosidase